MDEWGFQDWSAMEKNDVHVYIISECELGSEETYLGICLVMDGKNCIIHRRLNE